MARKPNYRFERIERERIKANKVAEKAGAKRDQRDRQQAEAEPPGGDRAEPEET